jgi:6-phosphogluconolactonase (cycloisomerase 2 family)
LDKIDLREKLGGNILSALGACMKRLIGYTAALCLLAFTVGCGGVSSTGTLAYVSNSTGTGFTVFTVNTDGTLTNADISPQSTPGPPKVLQFTPNGKWAYFLDAGGDNIYAYTRAGNGTLQTFIGSYPVNPGASSLVIAPNSTFLYVSLPNFPTCPPGACSVGGLAAFSIDPSTGILTQVGSNLLVGRPVTLLLMAPNGGALFGLSPDTQAVVAWSLNSTSGVATEGTAVSAGNDPIHMTLAPNGSYLYVVEHTTTTPIGGNPAVNCATATGTVARTNCSPQILGFSVSGTNLTAMAGSPFNENADLITSLYPQNPIAVATSNDSRYLFVANQGSANISVFKIATTGQPGELTEVLGSVTTVNGIQSSTASPFSCGTGCKTPAFITVVKANNALYVIDSNPAANRIFQLAINQSSGQLRSLKPASVGAETATSNPTWITIQQD